MRRTVAIRPATSGDVDNLFRLWLQLQQHLLDCNPRLPLLAPSAAQDRRSRYSLRIGDPEFQILVAEVTGGELIGTATGSLLVNRHRRPQRQGQLSSVWIASDYRRLGLCRQLTRSLLAFFGEAGIDHLILNWQSGNFLAERTWQSLGFSATEVTAVAEVEALLDENRATDGPESARQARIRPAVREDVDQVARMSLAFWQHVAKVSPLIPQLSLEGEDRLAETARIQIGDPDVHVLIGADEDGSSVSYAIGRIVEVTSEVPARRGQILAIWVDPGCRRIGVGRRMIKQLAKRWADARVGLAFLTHVPDDQPAEAFSKTLGFYPVDVFARAGLTHVLQTLTPERSPGFDVPFSN